MMIVLIMTASLPMIRDLEERYDPKRIEVTELYEADSSLSITSGCKCVATVRLHLLRILAKRKMVYH
jgi:hypothetical protein